MEALILSSFITIFASFRISRIMADVSEGGPLDWFHRIRDKIGVKYDESSEPYGTNFLSRMWICPYCNSYWIGLAVLALWAISASLSFVVLTPLAISGIIILIEERS